MKIPDAKGSCGHGMEEARNDSSGAVGQSQEQKWKFSWEHKETKRETPLCYIDLAIECLGVRVATIVVKMMKRKFAKSRFSNFGCAIPGLLAMHHRMVFAVLSRSSECRNSVVLVLGRLVRV